MYQDLTVTDAHPEMQEAFWTIVDRQVKGLTVEIVQKTLEWLLQEQLLAGRHQRTTQRAGYRNGFYRRGLLTPHGQLMIRVPRPRGGGLDCSVVFDRYSRRAADVNRILLRMYLEGIGTRHTAAFAEQLWGGILSHQTISNLRSWLESKLAEYRRQPIQPVYRVVALDGMHVTIGGQKRVIVLAVGLRQDGRRDVLGFSVGRGEYCVELLWDLRRRGLEGVEMFVTDDSPALKASLEMVYPEVPWQCCVWHRLRRLRELLVRSPYRAQMVEDAARIFRCVSGSAAREVTRGWARRWREYEPEVVQHFERVSGDSLTFYELPVALWPGARTTNNAEGVIGLLRKRLRLMGAFANVAAAERAVFGQLVCRHLLPEFTHNT